MLKTNKNIHTPPHSAFLCLTSLPHPFPLKIHSRLYFPFGFWGPLSLDNPRAQGGFGNSFWHHTIAQKHLNHAVQIAWAFIYLAIVVYDTIMSYSILKHGLKPYNNYSVR